MGTKTTRNLRQKCDHVWAKKRDHIWARKRGHGAFEKDGLWPLETTDGELASGLGLGGGVAHPIRLETRVLQLH